VVVGDGQDCAVVGQRQEYDHHSGDGEEVHEHDRQGDQQQHPDGFGDAVGGITGQPGKDFAGLSDRGHDHRQPRRQQDHVAGRIGGACYGDAGVGLFKRRRVVDGVAGHSDDVAAGLQEPHDAVFVFGEYLRETVGGFHPRG